VHKLELILTIFSLLQQEIYDAQKLSYFSHLTFIMSTVGMHCTLIAHAAGESIVCRAGGDAALPK